MLSRMKQQRSSNTPKKAVQFSPSIPQINIPNLPSNFPSKKRHEEIVLKRLRNIVTREENGNNSEHGAVSTPLYFTYA
uniref:CSON009940 protein n=1 Tax=Culicoides sonorensis TaxID=179676 RepID=A0A336LKK9_CULSO